MTGLFSPHFAVLGRLLLANGATQGQIIEVLGATQGQIWVLDAIQGHAQLRRAAPSAAATGPARVGKRVERELVELGTAPAQPLDFTEFYTEFAPRLHRWISRQVDSGQAQDLCQEAFTQAWRKWDKVSRYQNPHAWVFMVARQMLLRYQRKMQESAPAELAELPDNRVSSADSLIDFTRALAQLPHGQRRAAFLVFALEYAPAEAADLLGLNPSTLRSHLRRARLTFESKQLLDPPDPCMPPSEEDGR